MQRYGSRYQPSVYRRSLIMASYTQESGCDEKEQQKLFGQLFMLSAGMVALVFVLTLAGLLKFLG